MPVHLPGTSPAAGSHFAVACTEPDGSTVHAEVEQLMLAPGPWLADSLGLFGMSLGGIQVMVPRLLFAARRMAGKLACALGRVLGGTVQMMICSYYLFCNWFCFKYIT